MDKQTFSLSLFFPAYNEAANIEETALTAARVAGAVASEYEIILIDDGSTDETGQLADALAKENRRIRVIHHAANRGYGAALWSGIQAARFEYIFFSDTDLQFDLWELVKFLEYLPEYDAILGYRAKRKDPFMRLVNAKGWNMLNRILFGLKARDIDCAFKLFKASLIKTLPIESRGAMLSAELLILLRHAGVKFKEVPVTHMPRKAGSPTGAKPAVIFRALKEMLRAYRRGITARSKNSPGTTARLVNR